jgi:DNA primase
MATDGINLKRVAGTHGGEFAGPCPWCAGRDRFRAWPEQDRFWCRRCGRTGDLIQYLRDFRGMSYKAACEALGQIPAGTERIYTSSKWSKAWEPRQTREPANQWRHKASAFLKWTQGVLSSESGSEILSWLHSVRGLSEETTKKAGLGWNPRSWWRDRKGWGQEDVPNNDGKPKKLWLPEGLVIPYQVDGRLMRLRIRRTRSEDGPRYYLIPGSDTRSMILNGNPEFLIVLESELDAILVSQEAPDLVTAIALGNSSSRPDQDTHDFLCGQNGS